MNLTVLTVRVLEMAALAAPPAAAMALAAFSAVRRHSRAHRPLILLSIAFCAVWALCAAVSGSGDAFGLAGRRVAYSDLLWLATPLGLASSWILIGTALGARIGPRSSAPQPALRKRMSDVACAAIALVAMGAVVYIWPPEALIVAGWNGQTFTSAGWQAAGSSYESDRCRMLRSLLREHYPVGLTGPEVSRLLGASDWSDLVEQGYGVGAGWWSVDGYDLVLSFGRDGRVSSWGLLQN